MTVLEKIEARMMSGEPFTYAELGALNPAPPGRGPMHNDPDRLADRTIQKWRKAGKISFTRIGRNTYWTLTSNQG